MTDDPDRARRFRLALLALTLLGAALRVVHLDGTIGFDEAASVRRFVQGGPPAIFGLYSGYGGATSNHLVNSLLAWLAARAFGPEVWALRLPAFLFGCAVVPLVGILGARLTRERAVGLVAAFLAAVSPILVAYAPACRGYATLLVFTLLAALGALRALEAGGARLATVAGLVLALFLAGLSHMSGLVYLGALGLTVTGVLVVRWRGGAARLEERRTAARLFVALGVATVALVAWYSRGSSILHDVGSRVATGEFEDPSLVGLKSMVRSGTGSWFGMMGRHFLGNDGWAVWIPVALLVLGLVEGWRRRSAGLGLALGVLVFTPLLLLVGRMQPVPRYFLFVQPFLLVGIALGIHRAASAAARLTRPGLAAAALALLASAPGFGLLHMDLTGAGTSFMTVLRDVAGAVDAVAEEVEPDDVVIGFTSDDPRLPFGIRGFWQVFGFHEQLRLAPVAGAPREDPAPRAGERTVWFVTPRPPGVPGGESPALAYDARFEPAAERPGCRVERARIRVAGWREERLGPFPESAPESVESAGAWRFHDPFGGALYLLADDSPARDRATIEARWSGAVGELVSAPVPVPEGRLVEVETMVEAQQRSGLRPFARVVLRFLDEGGATVGEVTRMADLWPRRRPAALPATLRLATLAPRGATRVEVRLGLADGTHTGDRMTFRRPRLWIDAGE